MNKRPILAIPKTRLEKILDVLSICLLAITFFHLFLIWNNLPEKVPMHFNAAGNVDGWGGKISIWFLPILSLILFVMILILSKFPQVFNFPVTITEENAPKLYLEARRMLVIVNFEIVLFFSIVSWQSVRNAFGVKGIGVWYLPLFIIILLGTIVVSLYRTFRIR
ncbi:MAG TPA: DUF1648 domain-containing protein [Neobacillus sp.]|jgi:uncharacterized membrane protein